MAIQSNYKTQKALWTSYAKFIADNSGIKIPSHTSKVYRSGMSFTKAADGYRIEVDSHIGKFDIGMNSYVEVIFVEFADLQCQYMAELIRVQELVQVANLVVGVEADFLNVEVGWPLGVPALVGTQVAADQGVREYGKGISQMVGLEVAIAEQVTGARHNCNHHKQTFYRHLLLREGYHCFL